jgi:hypothetical protein
VIAHLNSTTQASEGQFLLGGSLVAHGVDRTGETIWIADAEGSLQRVGILGPSEGDTIPTDQQAVATFEPAPGWNTVNTTLAEGQDALQVAWAANVPFVSETDPSGFPTETIRTLPPDGIVMTAIGPRPYTGRESFPELHEPLDLSQGVCAHDNYEGQPAENVSKCRIDAMVGEKLLNVVVWFGSNRPTDAIVAEANEELDRLVLPAS